jgi:Ricin-type beta-trefoil lectin domain
MERQVVDRVPDERTGDHDMTLRRLRALGIALAALALVLVGTTGTAQAAVRLPASGGTIYGPEWRQIVNAESRLCVDIKQEDGSNTPAARAQQWNCTGVDEQHWLPRPDGRTPNVFTFVEGRHHLCLDVRNASQVAGQLLQQWPCNGNLAQRWQLMRF